ncbi:MAG TPA: hypothetical protein VGI08_02360 [Diaminobutyricibacter sp.]
MNEQVHRYFVGVIGFAFVACWSALGLMTALAALTLCAALVSGPALVSNLMRVRHTSARPRRHTASRSRSSLQERDHELPLVPDEPSLVLELGAIR